jgi:hypothetical protein
MFPQVFKNLQWSSAVVAMLCVLLVAVPDAVFTLATCGSTFLLIAFSACNYSAFVLLKKDGAPITRLLMPATALLFTTSVLVCAFVLETDVRKASMASCVVFGASIVGSFLVQKEDVESTSGCGAMQRGNLTGEAAGGDLARRAHRGPPARASLVDTKFHKHDVGGKGHLTAVEVASMLQGGSQNSKMPGLSPVEQIEKAAALLQQGLLTAAEFGALKRQAIAAALPNEAAAGRRRLKVALKVTLAIEDAIFRKYDGGGKGYLTKHEVATVMAVLGYEVDAEYIDGLLEISGSEGGVLDLEGFKIISQSLGTGADSATLEDAMFHKYKHDAGGKGYLAAGEVGSLLEDVGYGRVDSKYITGLLEIYGNEEGVLGPDGFKVFLQHLGGEVSEAETHELPALVELPSNISAPELHLKEEAPPSASSLRRRR